MSAEGRAVCPVADCGQSYEVRTRHRASAATRPSARSPRRRSRWPLWTSLAVGLLVVLGLFQLPFAHQAAILPGANVVHAEETAPAAPAQPDFATEIRPLLKTYCYDCHTQETQEGGLVIDGDRDLASILKHREQWTKVFERVRIGAMPPSDAPQPTKGEREKIAAWLDHALFYVDCNGPPHPGRVTVRRLNRSEYRNTVRDLLAVDLDVSAFLPQDDVGHGFDNIGDVLSVPPLLIEKYLAAAEQVAQRAAVVPDERAFDRTWTPKELSERGSTRDEEDGTRTLTGRGEFSVEIDVKKRGTYEAQWIVSGEPMGRDLPRTSLRMGEDDVLRFDVVGRKTQTFRQKTALEVGSQKVSLSLSGNRDRKPEDPIPTASVHRLRVRGPIENLPDLDGPASKVTLVQPDPEKLAGEGRGAEILRAARETLAPIVRRAFRRPVTEEEIAKFTRFVPVAMERGDPYERGVQVALQAVLVAPQFLFRVENGRPGSGNGARWLTDHELASRLSYFLWSSMPDEELSALAEQGRLSSDEVLTEQVRRMLDDPRSTSLIDNFASQWLALRKLFTEEVSPDVQQFPEFTQRLREDMATETEMFFGSILREDRPLTDLIAADYSFVNERLARLYRIEGIDGDEFRRVTLPEGRRGLLTHASILTLTSYPNRTSPVKRGEWILANLLGDRPPDPPPVVPGLEETQKSNPDLPLRKQLEMHRADAGCASCHKVMDELGFGLENYDAIGRWREKDGRFEVDSTGTLPTGETFRGATELTAILRQREEEFARCFVEKLLTFALGRGLEYYDKCAVDGVVDRVRKDGMRVSAAVRGIVLSAPFRMRGE